MTKKVCLSFVAIAVFAGAITVGVSACSSSSGVTVPNVSCPALRPTAGEACSSKVVCRYDDGFDAACQASIQITAECTGGTWTISRDSVGCEPEAGADSAPANDASAD